MSAFKDMVQRDRNVLINVDEFAEYRRIDGKLIPIVVDYDKLEDLKKGMNDAVGTADLYFFAKDEDMPKPKGYGSTLVVDDALYTVNLWESSGGVTEVACTKAQIS